MEGDVLFRPQVMRDCLLLLGFPRKMMEREASFCFRAENQSGQPWNESSGWKIWCVLAWQHHQSSSIEHQLRCPASTFITCLPHLLLNKPHSQVAWICWSSVLVNNQPFAMVPASRSTSQCRLTHTQLAYAKCQPSDIDHTSDRPPNCTVLWLRTLPIRASLKSLQFSLARETCSGVYQSINFHRCIPLAPST